MLDPLQPDSPHSAAVTLSLIARNGTFPLSHIGSNRIVLTKPEFIEAGEAEIRMSVDGREYRWQVVIRNHVVPFDPSTIRVRLRDGQAVTTCPPIA